MTRQPVQSTRGPLKRARWKTEISATMASLGLAVAFVSVTTGASTSPAADPAPVATPGFSRLASIPSHNRRYRASLIPASGTDARLDATRWTVELRDSAGRPVGDAALALETWMPDNERLSPARPRVTGYLGQGRYGVEGIRFDRAGWWNVRLQIAAPGGNDSLAFNLVR